MTSDANHLRTRGPQRSGHLADMLCFLLLFWLVKIEFLLLSLSLFLVFLNSFLCVSLSLSISLYLSLSLSISLFLSVSISLPLSFSVFFPLSLSLPLSLYINAHYQSYCSCSIPVTLFSLSASYLLLSSFALLLSLLLPLNPLHM